MRPEENINAVVQCMKQRDVQVLEGGVQCLDDKTTLGRCGETLPVEFCKSSKP